ncbi:hypothetical protein TA3x_004754 [Tundrisphaera sp. TA3]|uniref:hypothetical protein n=1 Tax=Tundrisphaera sp. TA3 TaxID=3435775 RepID=UPI003EC036CC
MEPSGTEKPTAQGMPLDLLRRGIDVYLEIAYPAEPPPESVRRRLAWPEDATAENLLCKPPFERVSKKGVEPPIYALRLGNARYPHMKMQIQPWDGEAGFLLSVNTHDHALSIDPDAPDAAAFMALQADNQRLKVAIEKAWDLAGLPTFPRYLRDYLVAQQARSVQPGELG